MSATAAVVATTAVVVSVAIPIGGGIRIASDVSGNGARLDLVNQILILLGLRSRQAQSLILVAQRLHLFVAHVVDNPVAQFVNCLESVAVIRLCVKAVLHIHLLFVAEAIGNLLRQVPASALNANANILNGRACIAAALCHLCSQIACVLGTLIAKSADSVINATEVVVQRVVQRGETVSKAIGLLVNLANEGLLVNSGADIGLCSARCAASIAIATAKAATKTVASPAEQQEDDNPILLS